MTKSSVHLKNGDITTRGGTTFVIDEIRSVILRGKVWRAIVGHDVRTGREVRMTVHESQRWDIVA